MTPDPVQTFLLAIQSGERGRHLSDGYDRLAREWRPRVRRFLRSPSPDEVEDWLSEAMIKLVVEIPEGRGQMRALAPLGSANPKGWRSTVLVNFLRDEARRRGRRRHVEQAFLAGMDADEEQARWNASKKERAGAPDPARTLVASGPPRALAVVEADEERVLERAAVFSVVRELPVLRAVVLVLVLDGDPSPLAEALAAVRGEPVEDVLARIEVALTAAPDHVHDYLTMAQVRVGWPDGADHAALDSARNALARARRDVRKILAEREKKGTR